MSRDPKDTIVDLSKLMQEKALDKKNKFDLGENVFYIKFDFYSKMAIPCKSEGANNKWIINTIIINEWQDICNKEINKRVKYNLYYISERTTIETIVNIFEEYIFIDWNECVEKAKELTKEDRWY